MLKCALLMTHWSCWFCWITHTHADPHTPTHAHTHTHTHPHTHAHTHTHTHTTSLLAGHPSLRRTMTSVTILHISKLHHLKIFTPLQKTQAKMLPHPSIHDSSCDETCIFPSRPHQARTNDMSWFAEAKHFIER